VPLRGQCNPDGHIRVIAPLSRRSTRQDSWFHRDVIGQYSVVKLIAGAESVTHGAPENYPDCPIGHIATS
jgi:hypothetical protein